MKYEIKMKKVLIAGNSKSFSEGSEIGFDVKRRFSEGTDHYLGVIKIITDDSLVLDNVEINRTPVSAEVVIKLDDIVDNSCSYVSVD